MHLHLSLIALSTSAFGIISKDTASSLQEADYKGWTVVEVDPISRECQDKLVTLQNENLIDLWSRNRFSVSPSNLATVVNSINPCPLTTISADLQSDIDRSKDETQILMMNNEQTAGRASHHSKYHGHGEIVSFFTGLQEEFPDLVEQFTLPVKTYEGRDIVGWRFRGLNATENTPELFYHGGIHAREWIGPAVLSFISEELVRNYGKDEKITELLDTFSVAIVPVLNVDGYIYSHEKDRMWRKNRQPTSVFWCTGTDINRNFDANWSGPGASSNPCSDAYYGTSAFSSPESRAIRDYITEHRPLSYIDWHAFSQLFMYPYGYSCDKTTDMDGKWASIAKTTAKAISSHYKTKFTTGPICATIYPASGSSIDWAFDAVDSVRYPFAIELRDTGKYGFLLPAKYIVPNGEEMLAGVLAMAMEIKEFEGL